MMSNTNERAHADAIDAAWDRHVRGEQRDPSPETNGFGEVIDALHRANPAPRPSAEFRRRLRADLLAKHPYAAHLRHPMPSNSAEDVEPVRIDSQKPQGSAVNSPRTIFRYRRRWIGQLAELAAIVAILIIAVAAVLLLRDGGDSDPQPTAIGDTDDPGIELTPDEHGTYHDLTFEQAQSMSPFELHLPDHLPVGYELATIVAVDETIRANAAGEQLPERDDGAPWMSVTLYYQNTENPNAPTLSIEQRNSRALPPVLPSGATNVDEVRDSRNIDDVSVDLIAHRLSDNRSAMHFIWHQDATGMRLTLGIDQENQIEPSRPGYTLSLDELVPVIESILRQRENSDEPPLLDGMVVYPPALDEESSVPGATSYQGLSFSEAQEIVPFDLVDPRGILDGYELAGISVTGPPVIDRGDGPERVGTRYQSIFQMVSTEVPGQSIELTQVNTMIVMDDLREHLEDPSGPQPEEGPVRPATRELDSVEIDGIRVNIVQIRHHEANGPEVTTYTWHQDRLGMVATAITYVSDDDPARDPVEAVSPEALRQFVDSIITMRSSDEMPPAPEERSVSPGTPAPPDESPISGGPSQYSDLTFEEAQLIVPYDLPDPRGALGHFEPETIVVQGELGEAGAHLVTIRLVSGDDPERAFLFYAYDTDTRPIYFSRPEVLYFDEDGAQLDEPVTDEIEIAGSPVNRTQHFTSPDLERRAHVTGLFWRMDGLTLEVQAVTEAPAREAAEPMSIEELEHFIYTVITRET
jgi:hypothetical protein